MSVKHKMAFSIGVIILIFLSLQIVFGDRGLIDLSILKQNAANMKEKNNRLLQENIALFRRIDRLNHDLAYIEAFARHELGVIAPHEQILKIRQY